jgi:spore germination protein YaaH
MKYILLILAFLFFTGCTGSPVSQADTVSAAPETDNLPEPEPIPIALPHPGSPLPVSTFNEIWGYVVGGRESFLTNDMPLTDICYFGAEVNVYGKLTNVPNRRNITHPGRVHLVIINHNRSLIHFSILPGSRHRRELIADIIEAAKDYDGLQINFENVPARDGEAFLSFLRELRAGLGDKVFSVAIPARTRRLNDDVYDYENIKPYVDRILIMAYDEHWSGSRPGSIASLDWCRRVAVHSLNTIGSEKLIMGLPFYGRAWGNYSPSRALIYNSISNIRNEHQITEIRRENGIPVFNYDVNVSITVYYEDEYSLSARMEMYKDMGVKNIGFWRVGQETARVWNILRVAE